MIELLLLVVLLLVQNIEADAEDQIKVDTEETITRRTMNSALHEAKYGSEGIADTWYEKAFELALKLRRSDQTKAYLEFYSHLISAGSFDKAHELTLKLSAEREIPGVIKALRSKAVPLETVRLSILRRSPQSDKVAALYRDLSLLQKSWGHQDTKQFFEDSWKSAYYMRISHRNEEALRVCRELWPLAQGQPTELKLRILATYMNAAKGANQDDEYERVKQLIDDLASQ